MSVELRYFYFFDYTNQSEFHELEPRNRKRLRINKRIRVIRSNSCNKLYNYEMYFAPDKKNKNDYQENIIK